MALPSVRVRPYRRSSRRRPEALSRPGREPHLIGTGIGGPQLESVIDDVKAGLRGGYTWTFKWNFDLNDPADMELVYNSLGNRAMYVVATTNRTLEEWEGPEDFSVLIGANEGVGVWRDPDTGKVYVDNVLLFFGPKVSEPWVLSYANSHGQKSIVKIDGPTRSYKFLGVTP